MTLPSTMNPSPEVVEQLRQMFRQKVEKEPTKIPPGGFHEHDLNKIFINDSWLAKFLENNDLDMKKSFEQLWDTCVWRKTENINEIGDHNVNMDVLKSGVMFPRGRDIDGKVVFIFRARLYSRGSRSVDDMKRAFVYWMERHIRESNDDYLTFMFELSDAGLSNVDMTLTQYIVNTLKNYYPYSVNYILVYDLPWILNATFQIIKKLLPAKAVDRLKNINSKSIREFIDEDNMLVPWGGKDDYVFEFIPDQRQPIPMENNNSIICANNNNNIMRKVHFANLSPTDSPMNESSNSNFENVEGEMLRITPQNTIAFTKSGTELVGNVEIENVDSKPITFKIKTTAPEKFRVRPSTGVLAPGGSTSINVVLQQGQQIATISREKFLVMCMALNETFTNSHDIAEVWKNTSVSNASVEQHRLKCALPINPDDPALRNGMPPYGDMFGPSAAFGGGDKQMLHLQQVVTQLSGTTHRLESQVRFHQKLQWITIALFVLLSITIVYILKAEIKSSASQYCLKP